MIIVCVVFSVRPSSAQAIIGSVACSTAEQTGSASSQEVPVLSKAEVAQKEMKCKYDGYGWVAAKSVVSGLTSSIVNWVNSGYKGGPSFVTNPDIFFTNVADDVTGEFLSKNGNIAKYLCSPFSIDIRLALALGQTNKHGRKDYECTLSTVINNAKNASINGRSIEGFVNGDFSQGGWQGFISLSESQNNASGAYLQAHSDLLDQIAGKQNKFVQQLNQGLGFLSNEKCDKQGKNCHVTTPGSFIGSTLNKSSQANFDALGVADSIDEILGAVLQNFLQNTLTGGLTGASEKPSGSTKSLVQMLQNESEHPAALQSYASDIAGLYGVYISNAEKAVKDYTQAFTAYSGVANNVAAAQSCYLNLANVGTSKVQDTLAQVANFNTAIIASTTALQTKLGKATILLSQARENADAAARSADLSTLQNNSASLEAYKNTQAPVAIEQAVSDAKRELAVTTKTIKNLKKKADGYVKGCTGMGGTVDKSITATLDTATSTDAVTQTDTTTSDNTGN